MFCIDRCMRACVPSVENMRHSSNQKSSHDCHPRALESRPVRLVSQLLGILNVLSNDDLVVYLGRNLSVLRNGSRMHISDACSTLCRKVLQLSDAAVTSIQGF